MAATVNLSIDQGSSFSTSIVVKGSTGNPTNLTGYTAYAQMRKSYYSSTAYNFTASISGPTTGTIMLALSPTASAAIPAGRYVYDVEINADSTITRVVQGTVTVDPEVTQTP